MEGSSRNNITGSSGSGRSTDTQPWEAITSFGRHGNRDGIILCSQGNSVLNITMRSNENLGTTERFMGGSNQNDPTESSEGNHEMESSAHEQSTEDDFNDVDLETGGSIDDFLLSKKRRSKVWKDFKLQRMNNEVKASCNHCKAHFVAGNKSGTSHLKYHLKICPELQSSKRRKIGTPKADIPMFDQQQSREDMASMIVCHNYPFNMSEYYYTRRFLTRLQPFFKLVHRTCLTEDCLKLYEIGRVKLYGILNKNASRVSITSDLWTATEKSSYMSMTAHYIDSDWKLHKKILGFVHIEGSHNGENVGGELVKRLYDWNLDRKLFSFVLDNSSVNDAVIKDILGILLPKKVLHLNGELFHIRCAAHILNLVVQDGLRVIQAIITNVRETVKYVRGSSSRKQKFRVIAQQVKAPNLSLKTDTPTRWNSTFTMLQTAQKFRDAFTRLKERDPGYTFLPSDDEWQHLSIVTDCLKVFYEVTKRVSGTKYPTASLYFNDYCGIYLLLRDWEHSDNTFVATMAKPMLEKFEKYWRIASKLLAFATILDPRYKLKSIEYYYGLLYGEFEAQLKVEDIKKKFGVLFDEYESEATQSSSSTTTCRNFEMEASSTEASSSLYSTRVGLTRFIHQSNSSQHRKSELEVYLEDPCHPEMEDDRFNIIEWWKLHGPKYPIISKMARDILSVPMSSVASESAFSIAGLVINKNRCSLLPGTVEALMCTQDWLRGDIPDESRMGNEDIFCCEHSSPTPEQGQSNDDASLDRLYED